MSFYVFWRIHSTFCGTTDTPAAVLISTRPLANKRVLNAGWQVSVLEVLARIEQVITGKTPVSQNQE